MSNYKCREEIEKKMKSYVQKKSFSANVFEEIMRDIDDIPSADVQPVKHGRWIEVTPKHSRCSVCDTTCLIAVYPISKGANYCPNCGARMDGDIE